MNINIILKESTEKLSQFKIFNLDLLINLCPYSTS